MTMVEGGKWSSYAMVTPIIESRRLRILKREQVAEIARAPKISDAIVRMENTDLGVFLYGVYREGFSVNDLESSLWQFLASEVSFLSQKLPPDARLVLDTYLSKYDVLNIKAAIRKIMSPFTGQIAGVPLGSISRGGKLEEILGCSSLDQISEVLKSLSMEDYATATRKTPDRMNLELDLDNEYCSSLLRISKKINDSQVCHFFGVLVDLTNMFAFLRGIVQDNNTVTQQVFRQAYMFRPNEIKKLLTCTSIEGALSTLAETYYYRLATRLLEEYKRTHDMIFIESQITEYLNRLSDEAFLTSTFTPGHILSYVLSREREIRSALMILRMVEEQLQYDTYAKWFSGEQN